MSDITLVPFSVPPMPNHPGCSAFICTKGTEPAQAFMDAAGEYPAPYPLISDRHGWWQMVWLWPGVYEISVVEPEGNALFLAHQIALHGMPPQPRRIELAAQADAQIVGMCTFAGMLMVATQRGVFKLKPDGDFFELVLPSLGENQL